MGNRHESHSMNGRTDACKEQCIMCLSVVLRPLLVGMALLVAHFLNPGRRVHSNCTFLKPIVPLRQFKLQTWLLHLAVFGTVVLYFLCTVMRHLLPLTRLSIPSRSTKSQSSLIHNFNATYFTVRARCLRSATRRTRTFVASASCRPMGREAMERQHSRVPFPLAWDLIQVSLHQHLNSSTHE